MNMDTLMEHLMLSVKDNYQGEQHKNLLDRILFDGKLVSMVDYRHAKMVYNVAKWRAEIEDTHNARLFLYYTARAMGLVQ